MDYYSELNTEEETISLNTFEYTVAVAQSYWRADNPSFIPNTLEISPLLVDRLNKSVLGSFPTYLSDLSESIYQTHPNPAIFLSCLLDSRIESSHSSPFYKIDIPEWLSRENQSYWMQGAIFLEELATELLTPDILELNNITRVLERNNRGRKKGTPARNIGGLSEGVLKEILGTRELPEEFKQKLIRCYILPTPELIGSDGIVDGLDLEGLSILVGAEMQKPMEQIKGLYPSADKKGLYTRLVKNLSYQGVYCGLAYPGVITIPLGAKVMGPTNLAIAGSALHTIVSGSASSELAQVLAYFTVFLNGYFFGARGIRKDIVDVPNTLVHELIHYYSHSHDRIGFMPLKAIKSKSLNG